MWYLPFPGLNCMISQNDVQKKVIVHIFMPERSSLCITIFCYFDYSCLVLFIYFFVQTYPLGWILVGTVGKHRTRPIKRINISCGANWPITSDVLQRLRSCRQYGELSTFFHAKKRKMLRFILCFDNLENLWTVFRVCHMPLRWL